MTRDEALRAGWKQRSTGSAFADLVDAFWSRRQGDAWSYAAIADARHVNHRGVVHGGLLLGFADHALGLAVWEQVGRRPVATVHLGLQFVDAAQPGEFIELDVNVTRTTRSLVFVRGTLRFQTRIIATADGLWKILGSGSAPDVPN